MNAAGFAAADWSSRLETELQHQLADRAPPQAAARLLAYLNLIGQWNRVYNLTAVRDPAEMLVQHLLDSIAVLSPLRRELGMKRPARVLDVGSGAGLPGVVIAVACPDMEVVCVDAVAKKASFVRQVAATLGCSNLLGVHSRVEALRTAPFDLVTARAFASLPDLVGLTIQHLAPDGRWMAMKGKRPSEEIHALDASRIEVFHVEQLRVAGLNADRCLVWMRPR